MKEKFGILLSAQVRLQQQQQSFYGSFPCLRGGWPAKVRLVIEIHQTDLNGVKMILFSLLSNQSIKLFYSA